MWPKTAQPARTGLCTSAELCEKVLFTFLPATHHMSPREEVVFCMTVTECSQRQRGQPWQCLITRVLLYINNVTSNIFFIFTDFRRSDQTQSLDKKCIATVVQRAKRSLPNKHVICHLQIQFCRPGFICSLTIKMLFCHLFYLYSPEALFTFHD